MLRSQTEANQQTLMSKIFKYFHTHMYRHNIERKWKLTLQSACDQCGTLVRQNDQLKTLLINLRTNNSYESLSDQINKMINQTDLCNKCILQLVDQLKQSNVYEAVQFMSFINLEQLQLQKDWEDLNQHMIVLVHGGQ